MEVRNEPSNKDIPESGGTNLIRKLSMQPGKSVDLTKARVPNKLISMKKKSILVSQLTHQQNDHIMA
jgi:hypothetical protein